VEDTYTHVLVVGSSDPEGTKIEIKGELKLKSDIEGIAEQSRMVRRYMRSHNGSG
jgi:hypothetical protein